MRRFPFGVRPKHGNKKIKVDGMTFDSKREYARWLELVLLERSGEITSLRRQVPFILVHSVKLDGRTKPAVRYIADHVYNGSDGLTVVEDAKSPHLRKDPVYRLKKHLMMAVHSVEIREV